MARGVRVAMMGRREDGQRQFFYELDLDQVPLSEHLVLDLGWVHTELAPRYSHTGRPPIDPVLMIRVLGNLFASHSERCIGPL
jgi:hypothetical protein